MTMPRPKGEALEIAKKTIPGLARHEKTKKARKTKRKKASLSRVEVEQTNNIENKTGLVPGFDKY